MKVEINAVNNPRRRAVRGKTRRVNREAAASRRLRRLFWDRELRAADIRAHPRWVVERALEYGSLKDVRTLVALLGRRRFLELAGCARFSSERTAEFWKQMLKQEGMTCAVKFSRPIAWNC